MKTILAISGGVDSVVLLDLVARGKIPEIDTFAIAHFDHGIRAESSKDAEFVAMLAKRYNAKVYIGHGNLGPDASEELARGRRYDFLRQVQQETISDQIATAHHADDIIETIAINIVRGTGWRGLAPLSGKISRPLLSWSKAEIIEYAITHDLSWVEDETNDLPKYLRNRVRMKLERCLTPAARARVLNLYERQGELASEIDEEIDRLLTRNAQQMDNRTVNILRYFLVMIDERTASEILNRVTKNLLTRPQLAGALLFVKTAKSGKTMKFGERVTFSVKKSQICVQVNS